jgi:hypothetical protein
VLHWTHEGYYAGVAYCGISRRTEGFEGCHRPHWEQALRIMNNRGEDFCPACRAEAEAAHEDWISSPEYAEMMRREAAENAAFGR